MKLIIVILTQESSVEMAIALVFFFIIATAVFVAIAIFLPEWVGIAGAKSQEVMREQAGDITVAEKVPPGQTPEALEAKPKV